MLELAPYQQAGLPIEERVVDLVGRMTLGEKLGQVNVPFPLPPIAVEMMLEGRPYPTSAEDLEAAVLGELADGVGPIGGVFVQEAFGLEGGPEAQVALRRRLADAAARTRLGIPLLHVAEGTHGVQATGATIFPEGPGLGSTWDPALVHDVYAAVAAEARAVGAHALCTLVVEPIRDPRLGRNCEAYSEDPHLNAVLARAIVDGAQGDGVGDPAKAAAILTHFPGQSEPVGGMERGAIELSERVLREAFLPPWLAAAGPGGAHGVMATYATVDGLPIHGHAKWLRGILRDEIGFGGIVLGEGFGFETLQYEGIVETQAQAGALALAAGVDVSITWEEAFRAPLGAAIRAGELDGRLLDDAVARVLRLKLALGLFEDPLLGVAPEAVHRPEQADLALRAARESIVLLTNGGGLLPLPARSGRVAVIGPNADDARSLLGDYVAADVSQSVPTILDVLRGRLGAERVAHARGCDVTDLDDAGLADAAAAARGADVAVVVLGERAGEMFSQPSPTGGERHDVQTLDLSGRQQELLEAVHATGTPVVLVLVNGRPLSVTWAAEHVEAIIEAWLPGERGAEAIVDVLLGVHDPSGRLSVTFPRSVGQLPAYYNHRPSKRYWIDQGGYVDALDSGPLFCFGHGLSYTTFSYADLRVTGGTGRDTIARVGCTVRNTGDRRGSEVVQLYLYDRSSSVATPVQQLRAFAKVDLEPGASTPVSFDLAVADLALLGLDGAWVAEAGTFDVMVGASCEDIRLRGQLVLPRTVRVEPGGRA